MRRGIGLALFFSTALLSGCAAIFRESRPSVRIESDPGGARARSEETPWRQTPTEIQVPRKSPTTIIVVKDGYADHRALVRKRMNGAWMTFDIVTCIVPVTLCIPLLADAISGAWIDVEPTHRARLGPGPIASASPPSAPLPPAPAPPRGESTSTRSAAFQMSDSERKAAARAAYLEGVALQDKGDCAGALTRLETAQKLYEAPTHLVRIAECQALTGKLVEAQETYETLLHLNLPEAAPEVFREAQEAARRELPTLRGKIPILRVDVARVPQLAVTVNGARLPTELVGMGRPVNPGSYELAATAPGYRPARSAIQLREGESRTVELPLAR